MPRESACWWPPPPAAIVPGNHVAADLLARVAVDKYVLHLPEYRQVKRLAELGLRLPASTLNDWVHATAARLYPLYESLGEAVRASDYLQVDEVPCRVADRQGACRAAYLWQFLDARPDSCGCYFHCQGGSRSRDVPLGQLRDFRGALQTGGYAAYDIFEGRAGVALLGSLAHVRRKFTDAQGAAPALAAKAVEWIGLLHKLEDTLRGAPPQRVAEERRRYGLPILRALEAWMQSEAGRLTPKDSMRKAMAGAIDMLPRLRRYALDGRYRIDNNAAIKRGQCELAR